MLGSACRDNGLVIQGIESGGRIHRDGRLAVGDRIVAVNGHSLRGVDFPHAQRIFREALSQDQHVCLGMQRKYSEEEEEQNKSPPPPPVYPKPSNQLSSNTRKMGRKIILDLVKGPNGLGFSLTTRDNPAGTTLPPVYVKNVLPMGAAIEDGRLRAGDRLLEIDGCEVRSQTEAVAMLRSVPMGETVHITVSRQDSPPSLPRQLPSENEDPAEGAREVLTFKIPLNDTGSAGLGISLKGKSVQAPDGSYIDLGIFIKSIFHGGAAYKDGRLKTNDQLVNVNGTSLLSLSNSEAMDALRRTMTRGEGPILLSVARRVSPPFPDCEDGPLNETYHLNGGVHEDDTSSSECFSRDGLGRQSMSEKRHGQLDAKVTDTYKRAKENRVLKEESATPVPPPPSEQPPPSCK
ncbi:PARD3 [Cordylochernes scorpioides]|uniref:PARD3 n=1 Tax=Cordylochernes scorpioides TaxID=51811 RepID=A0ABY6K2W5_9ARAC|nr:PARD3 [Cordylochernes scorpioides]